MRQTSKPQDEPRKSQLRIPKNQTKNSPIPSENGNTPPRATISPLKIRQKQPNPV